MVALSFTSAPLTVLSSVFTVAFASLLAVVVLVSLYSFSIPLTVSFTVPLMVSFTLYFPTATFAKLLLAVFVAAL